jgi:hypothetical protein
LVEVRIEPVGLQAVYEKYHPADFGELSRVEAAA